MAEALVNSNEGDTRNAGYVHRVIGGQLAKRNTPQALALAAELELGLGGPFEAFIQGIVGRGQFPGFANMTSVVRKVPADHWVRGNVFSWIEEHEASEDVLPWASINLSPAGYKALSILYEPPPEPAPPESPSDPLDAAQRAWELGNLGTWELGNLGTWELGNLGTWELGNLGTWER